ncbi:MAG TPA: hypothetical protein VEY91_04080, partial [Candidatus Limnocylindria bacterium]|nr:hypothetical protein [Candidatus Limnocylindria bacterium]
QRVSRGPLSAASRPTTSRAINDVLDFPPELDGRTDLNLDEQDQVDDLALMVRLLLSVPQPSANNGGVASACP